MSSRQKKIIGTTTAVILILALGLAGTLAASGSTDSSGNIEGTVDTSIFLHDDFAKDWKKNVRDRDIYVENTGDTSLYVRVRLDEFMQYGNKILAGTKGSKTDPSGWNPHIPAGTEVSECDTEIHDYFTIRMGNDTGITYKPKTKNAYDPAVPEAEKTKTAPAAEVVLIENYLQAKKKPSSCWVLDTADGYAYWHTQLKKGTATGLILNSITNTGLIDESYFYGINAKAEAVTEQDLSAWFHGRAPKDSTTGEAFDQASKNAVRLLKNLSPKYIEITEEMAANGAKDYDDDNDGYLTKKENAQYEADKGVSATPTPTPTPTPELNSVQKKVKEAAVGASVALSNTAASPYGETTEWVVLNKTEEEAVLITKQLVTLRQFHTADQYPTWPKSDLRGWLNSAAVEGGADYTGTGYLDTLGTETKQAIKEENIKTAKAYNDWTEETMPVSKDKVWLLTETGSGNSVVAKNPGDPELAPSSRLSCDGRTADGNSTFYWWLRSPDLNARGARRMHIYNGSLGYGSVDRTETGVRPCMTVRLK